MVYNLNKNYERVLFIFILYYFLEFFSVGYLYRVCSLYNMCSLFF